jgi:ribosomal-protein-alanine N-acetyltransferase
VADALLFPRIIQSKALCVALFGLTTSLPPGLAARGHGLMLRRPQMSDFPQWAQLREGSRGFLTPWEPIWPSDDLTRAGFRRRLRRYAEDIAADRSYPFLIFRDDDGALLGGVTLANVRRGIVQAGTVGYWVGEPFAGEGHMTTALRVLLPFLFSELTLHRIEAACIPTNTASVRVLEKCGFVREGLARRYLCINGVWQDHLLFGLLNEDFRG